MLLNPLHSSAHDLQGLCYFSKKQQQQKCIPATKTYVHETGWLMCTDWLMTEIVVGSCEHDNEPSGSIKGEKVLVGFEVFRAVVMKNTIFWDMTPCSPLSCAQRFGGTYRLHLCLPPACSLVC
jgi:hypothetical protein